MFFPVSGMQSRLYAGPALPPGAGNDWFPDIASHERPLLRPPSQVPSGFPSLAVVSPTQVGHGVRVSIGMNTMVRRSPTIDIAPVSTSIVPDGDSLKRSTMQSGNPPELLGVGVVV